MLTRVGRIFEQLNNAWDVLRTMTPNEYTRFRKSLGKSSGFQSAQYREVEFILGNRNLNMLAVHSHDPTLKRRLIMELERPSLYSVACTLLENTGPMCDAQRCMVRSYIAPRIDIDPVPTGGKTC